MAQYPIPQFIEQEGKIVFFLTYRQFFLLVGGGAACALLYAILPFYIFAVLAIIIMAVVAAIAFVKIDNASILTILLNYAGFSVGAKTYTWKKKESSYPFKIKAGEQEKNSKERPALTVQGSKLSEIKKIVETQRNQP